MAEIALSVITLAIARQAAHAAPISDQQAKDMAEDWLKITPNPLKTPMGGKTISQVQTFKDPQGTVLFYAIALHPAGFIITSADTEVEPVIAFASKGQFDAVKSNPLFPLAKQDMASRLNKVREKKQTNAAKATLPRLKWVRLGQHTTAHPLDDTSLTNVDDVRVAPFLDSQWNQSTIYNGTTTVACYNYYTPPYGAGNPSNYVCGCNNTALAEIMRYFKYPTKGVGTSSFQIEIDGVSTSQALRGGDGAGGPYQWSQMSLVPGTGTTVQECEAIGALTADIGTVCGTSFAADDSISESDSAVLQNVVTVFGFSSAIYQYGFTADFTNELNPNLDARLPVYLCIYDAENDGHAVVCDGYGYNLGTAYDHISLGWGGYCDAWYNLPDINTPQYDYDQIVGLYYNIFTNGGGEIISGRVVTQNNTPISGARITATDEADGTYNTTTDTNGIYALAQVPSDSGYTLTVTKPGYIAAIADVATGLSTDNECGDVWAANFVLQSGGGTGSMELNLSVANGQARIAWPAAPAAFVVVVQSTGDLSTGAWTTETAPVQVNGSNQFVDLPVGPTQRFFRLQIQ